MFLSVGGFLYVSRWFSDSERSVRFVVLLLLVVLFGKVI